MQKIFYLILYVVLYCWFCYWVTRPRPGPGSTSLCEGVVIEPRPRPSHVVNLTGVGGFADVAQCAMQCTRDGDCSGFNMKIQLCETYSYVPTRFAVVPGCAYGQVIAIHKAVLFAKLARKILMLLHVQIKQTAQV